MMMRSMVLPIGFNWPAGIASRNATPPRSRRAMADCGTLRIAEGTEIGRLAIAPDDGSMQGVDDGKAAGVGLANCQRGTAQRRAGWDRSS